MSVCRSAGLPRAKLPAPQRERLLMVAGRPVKSQRRYKVEASAFTPCWFLLKHAASPFLRPILEGEGAGVGLMKIQRHVISECRCAVAPDYLAQNFRRRNGSGC